MPVHEQDDPGRVYVRPRFCLNARPACERHEERGRVPGMGLRDEVAGVERVRGKSVQLPEEVAQRRLDGRRVGAVPKHAQHGLALIAGRRPPHRGDENATDAARAFKVGQGHRFAPRQVLMRQHAVGDEAVGQVQAWEVHAGG